MKKVKRIIEKQCPMCHDTCYMMVEAERYHLQRITGVLKDVPGVFSTCKSHFDLHSLIGKEPQQEILLKVPSRFRILAA